MQTVEAARLRDVGLRVTRPRVAVLAVLDEARDSGEHLLVHDIVGRTRTRDCVVGDAPCLEPSQHPGFSVGEAEVTFWGLCPDCSRTTSTTAG
jgi:Fe2+ or Zn2+ uptake regulation protein